MNSTVSPAFFLKTLKYKVGLICSVSSLSLFPSLFTPLLPTEVIPGKVSAREYDTTWEAKQTQIQIILLESWSSLQRKTNSIPARACVEAKNCQHIWKVKSLRNMVPNYLLERSSVEKESNLQFLYLQVPEFSIQDFITIADLIYLNENNTK